jgi:hypothetical protein
VIEVRGPIKTSPGFNHFDPAHIEVDASIAIPNGSAVRVSVEGTLAFVAAESGGLQILRVAMPARLAVTGIGDRAFHFSIESPMWSLLEIQWSYDLRNWYGGHGDILVQDSPYQTLKDDFDEEPQFFFRAFWR